MLTSINHQHIYFSDTGVLTVTKWGFCGLHTAFYSNLNIFSPQNRKKHEQRGSFLIRQMVKHKCNKIIMKLTSFPPQVVHKKNNILYMCCNGRNLNVFLSRRSGSVDLEPLPSQADSSAPANHRGSLELGSQSKWRNEGMLHLCKT